MLNFVEIKSLLESVVVSEFEGISCNSINGKAWFDIRDKALKAISESERKAADDELPVDEKFLREMFPIPESWCHCRILAGGGMLLVENAAESWSLWHEGEEIVEFMTRKKVRNLVELLKDEA